MTNDLKKVHKKLNKELKEGGIVGQKTDKRAKKLGLIPGVDSPYQWVPVGQVTGTNKEAF